MKTVRRLLYRDILGSVAFVAVAFLALFFFFDFVNALEDVGKRGFGLQNAVLRTLLLVPGHLYELLPIAVLIGAIFSLARMAQTSEYTILRTGGLGPGRALGLLATLGVGFAVLTFAAGDVLAPLSARVSVALKSSQSGGRDLGRTGAWLRDQRQTSDGVRNVSANVARVGQGGDLEGVRLFEHDQDGRLRTRVSAVRGRIVESSDSPAPGTAHWQLEQATVMQWNASQGNLLATALDEQHATLRWPTQLAADVVAAAVQPAGTMSTLELWRYATHLNEREQSAQRYTIQFWKKAFYPLACFVMLALALPFAYLNARAGGVSLKVFGGIMLGISFVLLNSVAEHLGVLSDWTPWVVAAAPSLLYLVLSLAAFAWLVRYR
jgi:lipopolysaccharide export system permease protein